MGYDVLEVRVAEVHDVVRHLQGALLRDEDVLRLVLHVLQDVAHVRDFHHRLARPHQRVDHVQQFLLRKRVLAVLPL